MSNKQINIKENIMEKIKENKISMKPKSYFVIGSLLTFIGLVTSVITSVFLISIISFILRAHGPMANYKLSLIISSFPLWIPFLAIFGLISGIILLKKYDFSYRTNFLLIIIGFILVIIISGLLIDGLGVNKLWLNQGPMRGIMRQYLQNGSQNYNNFDKTDNGYNINKNFRYNQIN